MSIARTIVLLCASLAAPALAWAQEVGPFVTQLRLPARGAAVDVIAWRVDGGIEVARADLERLDFVLPQSAEERVSLDALPGLSYREDTVAAAIVLTCTTACLQPQLLRGSDETSRVADRATGAYLNYDVDLQWVEGDTLTAASVAEAVAFGRWGLIESSWLGATAGEARGVTRLESRWTIDWAARNVRLQFGDSTAITAGGAPLRFAGVQIGRHFGLSPSMITYPTALLAGEATSASTVELYVDGALRARDQVQAGPFVFDNAPLVTGGGDAQLVITDLAGRQQVLSRPFFVSTQLLRPGLSDWAVSAGAERENYGAESDAYGDAFFSGRYRRGVSRFVTTEVGLDIAENNTTAQAGVSLAHVAFGQVRLAHARNDEAGASEISWFQDVDAWTVGLQADVREEGFRPLGRTLSDLQTSIAGNFSIDLGVLGAAGFTAAAVTFFEDEDDARTFAASYSPRLAEGAVSARVIYTEREDSELAFALSFSTALTRDVSGGLGFDYGDRGGAYRASVQRAADHEGGLGWRARVSGGAREYAELAASRRSGIGESAVQIARSQGVLGARIGHGGSLGVIDGRRFAAPRIRGAFALVDAGAANIDVLRDRFSVGETGEDGRVVVTGLRPYDDNVIAIDANDLPFDRTPTATEAHVTPMEGAGVVIRFDRDTAQLLESRAAFPNQQPAPRGAILVRERDGARFPIGSNGRVVLRGVQAGDVVRLDIDARCTAIADEGAATNGLVLQCGEA